MVRVCDAIMGTGKTSAAIEYMNTHPEDKFIYITPYLAEATRVRRGCPLKDFVEPRNDLKQYSFKKSEHTLALIKEGRNITTTHQAFKGYTDEMLEYIKKYQYTLIVDENVDVLESCEIHPDDLHLLVESGYVEKKDGVYSLANDTYNGDAFTWIFSLLKSRELFYTTDGSGDETNELYYWILPPELFTSFKDVYILTYLFQGQSLYYFTKIYNIPFEYIGIQRTDDGYIFGNHPGYVPEYITHLRDVLHVLDNSRLNDIGDEHYALSMNWFKQGGENLSKLKNNVSNYYTNIWRDVPADRRLWGSYNGAYGKVKGKGYAKAFLTFNAKATNAYKNRDCLVYIANVFMSVSQKNFYQLHGIEVDEDAYALSVMIQWLWRSAVREGNDVYVYIPSRRMRNLLNHWMDSLEVHHD